MRLGKIKWFGTFDWEGNYNKDYGFLQPLDGGDDVFFSLYGYC